MEYQLPPPLGHAVPVSKDHAISVHFPSWADVAGYGAGKSEVSEVLQNGYPRTFLHTYVREVCIYGPSAQEPDLTPRLIYQKTVFRPVSPESPNIRGKHCCIS